MTARLDHLVSEKTYRLPPPAGVKCDAVVTVAQSTVGLWAFGYDVRYRDHHFHSPCALAQFPTQEMAAHEGILSLCEHLKNWFAPELLSNRFRKYADSLRLSKPLHIEIVNCPGCGSALVKGELCHICSTAVDFVKAKAQMLKAKG